MRKPYAAYIVFGLLVIGIIARPGLLLGDLFLAFLVFGAIFLLYKYPPSTWSRFRSKGFQPTRTTKSKPKKHTFKVIDGYKKAMDDEEDRPKYH